MLLSETVFSIFDGTQLFDVDASFNEDQQSYQLVQISPKGLYLRNIITFFNIFASCSLRILRYLEFCRPSNKQQIIVVE